jgi:nicotinate dehydrogenase subunit B
VLQAASWTLKEQVHYGPDGVASRDWDTYPVLRFAEIPPVSVKLLDQPGAPSLGSGEATQGPTPAAIANAVFDAVGVRLREMPFTPERVKAALTQPQ